MPRTTRRCTVRRTLRVTTNLAARRATAPIIRLVEPDWNGHRYRIIVVRAGREFSYSFADVARVTGLAPSGVSRIFHGNRTGYISTLDVIAQALGISTDQLNTFLQTRRTAARQTPVLNPTTTRVPVRRPRKPA
jgi:hypothetical protein